MNKRIKTKWIRALRSGKYEQGKGSLKDGSNFCCLGVLCDLHAKETNRGKWLGGDGLDSDNYKVIGAHGPAEGALLPSAVARWAGIRSGPQEITFYTSRGKESKTIYAPILVDSEGIKVRADELNDNGANFTEIADAIKRTL